jgi:hypothetical protein
MYEMVAFQLIYTEAKTSMSVNDCFEYMRKNVYDDKMRIPGMVASVVSPVIVDAG